jgi:6-pyruvoyltetrahydropterin/6-carboxytetrahydropterin synthase
MIYTAKFTSTKVIPLGSCAFRQPYADSHCKFLHGYRLQAKFWFSCDKLDRNNWVVDFGALKELKTLLEQTFDHTTVIWGKDPQRSVFEMLHEKGIIDLRIFPDGVGIEKFAEHCFGIANKFIAEKTNNRCWVDKVEVWEHELNSATYERSYMQKYVSEQESKLDYKPLSNDESPVEVKNSSSSPEPSSTPQPQPPPPPTQPLYPPLYQTKTKNTYKDLFKGTSWGNK